LKIKEEKREGRLEKRKKEKKKKGRLEKDGYSDFFCGEVYRRLRDDFNGNGVFSWDDFCAESAGDNPGICGSVYRGKYAECAGCDCRAV
jgi:hypothetical protein